MNSGLRGKPNLPFPCPITEHEIFSVDFCDLTHIFHASSELLRTPIYMATIRSFRWDYRLA